MRKYLAIPIGVLFLLGCDMFISRGGEGQPCFKETGRCSGDLICFMGRCVREIQDGGLDGGDDGSADEDDGSTDGADDTGGDDGGAGDDGGDGSPDQPLHIYRSVGPYNNTSMAGEQNGLTLTFDNSLATFPNPLPGKVGVGDVIQYDSDSNQTPDALVFIHERISSTEARVANADGTPLQGTFNTQTWGVLRAYISLAGAITLYENTGIHDSLEDFDDVGESPRDLVARNLVWNIACYNESAIDDAKVTIDHWTTSDKNYLRIFTPVGGDEAGESQRHSGIWTTSAYRLDVLLDTDGQTTIQIGDAHVHIDGLQIGKNGNAPERVIAGIEAHGTTNLRLSNSIIQGTQSNGYGVFLDGAATLHMWNTIVYKTAETDGDGIHLGAGAHAFIYNVTLYDNHRGIYVDGNAGTDIIVKNVIAAGNVGTGGYDFDTDATFGIGSTHNCSSDASAGGGGMSAGITMAALADIFNAHLGDPPDLHLKSDAPCNNAGVNLKDDPDLVFTDDIDGDPRPVGLDPWDIGADENGT